MQLVTAGAGAAWTAAPPALSERIRLPERAKASNVLRVPWVCCESLPPP